ncbi:MAG: hypothetical protein I3273_06895 [Candidatus Moeniiplasma glomeromycotorum]|nr:hypothetical protein [Candidatus Moeniiplasma glomeromycotorum]MCE8168279.1 hypothetical protein [Candidatus Moeniiplasma glomeromycotorum]MCE8169813.1 hypothetical protein [Candidatus Moeniiplasma glomeromycotorum]
MVWKKTWNKKPKKGTGWAKFSRNRSDFKKINYQKPAFKPNLPKKDDWLDGVWEVCPATGKSTHYTPQQWKKREVELNKQTLESSILAAKRWTDTKTLSENKAEVRIKKV